MKYGVNEIFRTVQGEGVHTGALATFIRLQGCPVGCKWCDSVRTWAPTTQRTPNFIKGYGADVEKVNHEDYEELRGWVAGQLDHHGTPLGYVSTGPKRNKLLAHALNIQGVASVVGDPDTVVFHFEEQEAQLILNYFQPDIWRPYGLKVQVNGELLSTEDILRRIVDKNLYAPHFVITGGEPLIYDLDDLIAGIRSVAGNAMIQVETSGLNGFKGKALPDWVTWSPKQNLMWTAPLGFRGFVDEVKWVVDSALPFETFESTSLEAISRAKAKIVLMPEGCPPKKESIVKALQFQSKMFRMYPLLQSSDVIVADRLQYRWGVQ